MDFSQNTLKLPESNFDVIAEQKKEKRHGDLLLSSIHAIFSGPSNFGKTDSLSALLKHSNGLRFENVYVYSKSLNQAKYKFLEQLLEPIEGMQYLAFSDHDEVVSPADVLPNSIMILIW